MRDFDPQQHFTKPPARYTEASLIKELEVQGIGRPSTYATILTNLQDRLYVVKEKTALKPTEMGLVVSDLLVENFPDIMDPKFTAGLEDDLDRVAEGKVPWQQLMRDFYGAFVQHLDAAKTGMRKVKSVPTGLKCPECDGELVVRWGKNGEFVGCAAYPKCGFTGDFVPGCPGTDNPGGAGTGRPLVPGRSARPGPGGPGQACGHRAYLPQVRQRVAVAPRAAGRIFGLRRLPEVQIHPEFFPGRPGTGGPPGPGSRGRRLPLPPGRLRRPPDETPVPPGDFLRLQ